MFFLFGIEVLLSGRSSFWVSLILEVRMVGENDGDEGFVLYKYINCFVKEYSFYFFQYVYNFVSFLGFVVIYLCLIEIGMFLNMCFM